MNVGIIRPVRRRLRPAGKILLAVARWRRLKFDEAPPMLGNAKPKSGSHLLLQVLAGFAEIMPYAFVRADPVRTITKDGRRRAPEEVLNELKDIPRGVIGWGYVEATPAIIAFLCRPERVNYFIYRDPRDMLISQILFATEMYEDHGMHAYYNSLPDFSARLKAAISGVDQDGLKMVGVRQRYSDVLQWLEQKHVLCLRYEDLINRRDPTLKAMLDQVEKTGYEIRVPREKSLANLANAIRPEKSRTFRSGKTGGWREHFSQEHKKLFKEVAGDLLVQLGYENDNGW